MANFIVTNSQYPTNPKMFTVTVDKIGKLAGEPGTKFRKAGSDDQFWELHIAVSNAYDIYGNPIGTVWRDLVSEELDTVDKLIVDGVNSLSSQIDWSDGGIHEFHDDMLPPVVTSTSPEAGEQDVNIHRKIFVTLEDLLPAKGIDVDSIKLFVDGIEVVPDKIEGNPFKYVVQYSVPYVLEEIEDE